MEYIDGEDLASLLKRIGRLPGDKAVDIARQLCAGLAAAHDNGVLHRDLKPANVMIDGRGHVRITDFGIAVAVGEDLAAAEVSGTPAYMAPEQFAGKGASVRSDIYALGLVLYEVYTGRRAFDAATPAELRAQTETGTPRAASEITRDIDPAVDRVIRRCLEKDPRQRPASVAQVAAGLPDVTMRVEAGSYRGKPVYWSLLGPWTRPHRMVAYTPTPTERAGYVLAATLFVSLIVGGTLFARRNLRMGRGDRRGATRLASLAFALTMLSWLFAESHVATLWEIALFVMAASWALFVSALLWLLYVSLEPFVRRRWPALLVSWSRLLSGSVRDPLVGRDVLIGCVLGVVGVLLFFLTYPAAAWLGVPQAEPYFGPLTMLSGARGVVATAAWFLVSPVSFSLAILFLLFLLRLLLRSQWLAAALLVAILTAFDTLLGTNSPLLAIVSNIVAYGAAVFVLVRFGLLALATCFVFSMFLQTFPMTTNPAAWYAGIGFTGGLLALFLAVYGFHTSLGGKPLFGHVSIEE